MPVVVGVSVIVFAIVHLLPGDPVLAILSGANATPEQERELRAQLRLDDPLPVQYARFLARAAVGDFGRSIFTRRPVLEEIAGEHSDKLTIAKLDIDANPTSAQDYKVMSIPTMILFSGGKPVKTIVGAKGKAALLRDLGDVL